MTPLPRAKEKLLFDDRFKVLFIARNFIAISAVDGLCYDTTFAL